MSGSSDVEAWSGESDAGAVSLVKMGSVVVLDGPQDLVARLVAADPVLNERAPVETGSGAALGALASLATAIGSSTTSAQLFTLDPASLAAFTNGSLMPSAEGGLRLMERASTGGGIARHGSLTPANINPSDLASAQLALATMAITAAIKDVQKAVERVQSTVDLLRDHLEAQRIGSIGGLNAKLRRVADEVSVSGALSSVEWDEASGAAAQVDQHLAELRSFISKRLRAAEAEGGGLDDRIAALDNLRQLSEALTLLLVAEDNQLLYEQIRLHRIRDIEPSRFERAVAASTALIEQLRETDQHLIDEVRAATEDRVGIRELEIHRVFAAPKLADNSARIDELLAGFADQRRLSYSPVDIPERPDMGDAADELRARGGAALEAGGRAAQQGLRALDDAMNRRREAKKAERAAELETGQVASALPPGGEEDVVLMVDLDKRGDRLRRSLGRRRNRSDEEETT